MASGRLVVGTRGSLLAVTQTNWVVARLREFHPDVEVEIERITTRGDRHPDAPLPEVGQKGIFTKELEDALLERRIDLAVHSAKDLPQEMPAGLAILCVPPREDPRDALVSRGNRTLGQLPSGAVLGTSSLRRQAQLRLLRGDVKFCTLRGNVDTRINKVHRGDCDGTLLAMAGLNRVGLAQHAVEVFDVERVVPAPGQGILAVQGRSEDRRVADLLRPLEDKRARLALTCEQALVQRLAGGCATPIGALLEFTSDGATLTAIVASPTGERAVRSRHAAAREAVADLPIRAAEELLGKGAAEIIQACRESL